MLKSNYNVTDQGSESCWVSFFLDRLICFLEGSSLKTFTDSQSFKQFFISLENLTVPEDQMAASMMYRDV